MGVYEYTKECNFDKLAIELSGSSLDMNKFEYINYSPLDNKITINADLTTEEKSTLDGIINNHTTSYPEGNFSPAAFLQRMTEIFSISELNDLSKKAPLFVTLLQGKKFSNIKTLRDQLYTAEEITLDQKNAITNLFSEQNITLDNY